MKITSLNHDLTPVSIAGRAGIESTPWYFMAIYVITKSSSATSVQFLHGLGKIVGVSMQGDYKNAINH